VPGHQPGTGGIRPTRPPRPARGRRGVRPRLPSSRRSSVAVRGSDDFLGIDEAGPELCEMARRVILLNPP